MNCRTFPAVALLCAALPLGCNSRSSNPTGPTVAPTKPPAEVMPAETVDPAASAGGETVAPVPSIDPPAASNPAPAWMADLASSDAAVRAQATNQLTAEPDPTALLLEHLEHADPAIRRGAAFGLLSSFDTRNAKQTAALQVALTDDDEMVRRVALQAVSQWSQDDPVAAEAAVAPLEAIVTNSARDTFERSQAVRILGRLGSAAQPALIQTFAHDADANVRKAALAAAMRTRPAAESITPPLIKLLAEDANASLRRQAALHLKDYAGSESVQKSLASAFTDSDADVRLEAATSLAAAGPAALAFTTALLDDPAPQVRLYAVFTLGKMGRAAEPALAKLGQMTTDPDPNVAQTAAGVIRVIQASP